LLALAMMILGLSLAIAKGTVTATRK